jgi:Zn-dependent alcohol dehydrogenase
MTDVTSAPTSTPAGTVKATAAVLHELGAPLVIEEVELSAPCEGEVLVRMRGVGI